LFFPKMRKVAAIGGILYHFSVYLFAHINFWTLALCYVVFIDFEPLGRLLNTDKEAASETDLLNRKSQIVNRNSGTVYIGTLLLSLNILCGIALIDSWPFAVYPTFAGVQEKYIQSLTISFVNPDGTAAEIVPYKERSLQSAIHPSRLIGLFTQVLWAKDSTEEGLRGTALLTVLEEHDTRLHQARSIKIFKDICSVIPEEQSGNPVRRELLFSVER